MWRPSLILVSLALLALVQEGGSLYCHRCYSAMGGCGDDLNRWMFPWRGCDESTYCVKVIEQFGSDVNIIRECESELLKSTRHRLRMPVLRRHGYCLSARKNDPYNPRLTYDDNIKYCFCNDFNGCNTGANLNIKLLPVLAFSALVGLVVSKFC